MNTRHAQRRSGSGTNDSPLTSLARSLARSLTLLDCPPPPLPGLLLFFLLMLPLPLASRSRSS
jgi:hypothetical protein